MRCFFLLAALALAAPAFAQPDDPPRRPVATYSIVAHDAETGQMGVAVQSHWFSVGSIVPWAEAGVGAVATQSFVEPSYGPLGLELMASGRSAQQALDALTSTDDGEAVRQVAFVDASGSVAVHTGDRAIAAAGHRTGDGYSVQANMMERAAVWDAMAEAYESSDGDLAERLLTALEAAQAEGGDIRGKQSAALVIVHAEPTGQPWLDRVFDLRIEDHPEPVRELRRPTELQRAYQHLSAGDERVTDGDIEGAMGELPWANTRPQWSTCVTKPRMERPRSGSVSRLQVWAKQKRPFLTLYAPTRRTRAGLNSSPACPPPACFPTTRTSCRGSSYG